MINPTNRKPGRGPHEAAAGHRPAVHRNLKSASIRGHRSSGVPLSRPTGFCFQAGA
jgi:hypothetical protein